MRYHSTPHLNTCNRKLLALNRQFCQFRQSKIKVSPRGFKIQEKMEILGKYLASLFLLLLLTYGVQQGACQLSEELTLDSSQSQSQLEPASSQLLNMDIGPIGGELSGEMPVDAKIRKVTADTSDGIRDQAFKLEASSPIRPISYRWSHGTDVIYYFIKFEFFGRFWVVRVFHQIGLTPRAVDIRLLRDAHQPIEPF